MDSSGPSREGDASIDLLIETLTGNAFEMTASPSDTIAALKNKIQRVEGMKIKIYRKYYFMSDIFSVEVIYLYLHKMYQSHFLSCNLNWTI